MRRPGRKWFVGFLVIAVAWVSITGISIHLNKNSARQENSENSEWIASSKSWFNRQLCRWFGLCGISHLNSDRWAWNGIQDKLPPIPHPDTSGWWHSGSEDPTSWTREERRLREIPQYVFDHAPYVHLFSGEQFWPCDIAEHLVHTPPHINYTKITDLKDEANLTNLDELNKYAGGDYGRFVYLQSEDNVEERPRPEWLAGADNIPTAPEGRRDEDGDDELWTDFKDLKASEPRPSDPIFRGKTTEDIVDLLPALSPSPDGRCGGSTGFTCKGSKFGKCCSIYGWCGKGEKYCGEACNALAGACNDPFEPVPRPHLDLRKRASDLQGVWNRPSEFGKSSAPAILVVVPKEDGIVDAFWFFFYSFNLGQKVLNVRFGNHVGDWEHTLIRFRYGKPVSAFLSEHNFGDAFAWHALEKYKPDPNEPGRMLGTWSNTTAARDAKRPVVYSATGTHAMYGKPGSHPYLLPWGLLHDQTDRGPLWDPSLNVQSYTWDHANRVVRSSTRNPMAPTGWFHFAGHWGDKFYPLSDPRQYRFAGQYHYNNGPTGPRFKSLDRKRVCPRRAKRCHIRQWATDGGGRRMPAPGENAEEGGLPGGNSTDLPS